MTTDSFQSPRGVPDYWPPRSHEFARVRESVVLQAELAGYEYVEIPIFEHTEVFTSGIGAHNDVVTKEMYSFDDRGGRELSLRPEGTAGVCRLVAQHRLASGVLPLKLWYSGPFFRAERPQQGRYRQLQQVGIEAIGVIDPLLDAEVIAVANSAFQSLGLTDYQLLLNSLGGAQCRAEYREALVGFMSKTLPAQYRERIDTNPLRLLDDKSDEVRLALAQAPTITDYWTPEDRQYHHEVTSALSSLGIQPVTTPKLVRGLDYYTGTVFEFAHQKLGAQSAIGGGGRYDGLLAALGGPDLSGVGFGVGIDRTLLACESEGTLAATGVKVSVFVVPITEAARREGLILIDQLRVNGVTADMSFGERGLKGSMKAADKSGARFAIIIGEQELAEQVVVVKNMSDSTQVTKPIGDILAYLLSALPDLQSTVATR